MTIYYYADDCYHHAHYIDVNKLMFEIQREKLFADTYTELQHSIDNLMKTDAALANLAQNVLTEVNLMRENLMIHSYSHQELILAMKRTSALIKTPMWDNQKKITPEYQRAQLDCSTSIKSLRSISGGLAASGALAVCAAAVAIAVTIILSVFAVSFMPLIPAAICTGFISAVATAGSVRFFKACEKHIDLSYRMESVVEAANRRQWQL
jgi:hypothetical protein